MKPSSFQRSPDHASYRSHRRQVWYQIILPVVLGALVLMVAPALTWQLSMGGGGDLTRWAEISTMWLLFPVMIGALLLLAALLALIFVAGRIYVWIPRYSQLAQRLSAKMATGARRGAEMIRSPALAVQELGRLARTGVKRLRERV